LLGYGWFPQLTDQWPTLALSAVAGVVGWAVLHWTKAGFATMLLGVFLSAATYIFLAILIRSDALQDLRSVANALRAKQASNNR
jgi:hypothetical protein